jgi:hypothetical protein
MDMGEIANTGEVSATLFRLFNNLLSCEIDLVDTGYLARFLL